MSIRTQRLLTLLSPTFPVGAFAYSAGLEQAIASGKVQDRARTGDWIGGQLRAGSARIDAVFLTHAYAASNDSQALATLSAHLLALTGSRQRHAELRDMGRALDAARAAWGDAATLALPVPCAYPVALGALGATLGLPLSDLLEGFLTAYVQAQASVAVRLVPLGQSDALAILAGLEAEIAAAAADCASATLDQLGAISYAADIAAMAHETLSTRIFRS